MRINNIHSNTTMNPAPTFQFNEGARTCAEKIAAFVVGILTVLATYFLVSPQAGAIAGAVGVLLSMIFYTNHENTEPNQVAWYHPIVQAGSRFQNWFVNAIPVFSSGERVSPGEGHYIRPGYLPEDNRLLAIHPIRAPVGQGVLGHAGINPQPERPLVHPQHPQNARRAPVGQGVLGHAGINPQPEHPPVHPQHPQNARRAPVNFRA